MSKFFAVIFFCILSLSYGNTVEVFKVASFKDQTPDVNTYIAAEKRGYTLEPGKEGIIVNFKKYAKGNAKFAYIGLKGKQLAVNDWSGYDYVNLRLESYDEDHFLPLEVLVRDNRNKIYFRKFNVGPFAESSISLPIKEIAKKINIKAVNLFQVAVSQCVNSRRAEFKDIELIKSAPVELIPRKYDILQELSKGGPAVVPVTTTKFEFDKNGKLLWEFAPHSNKVNKYPGLALASGIRGSLLNGDLRGYTHIVLDIDYIDGNAQGMGLRVADHSRKEFWKSFKLAPSTPNQHIDERINTANLNFSNISHINISGRPDKDKRTVRVNQFYFEIRPQEASEPVRTRINLLLNDSGTPANVKPVLKKLLEKIDNAQKVLSGDMLKRSDLINFFDTVENCRSDAELIVRNAILAELKSCGKDFNVGIADSMTPVFLEKSASNISPARKAFIELAGQEFESFQTVVYSPLKNLKNVKVSVSDLIGPKGAKLKSEVAVVGHCNAILPAFAVDHHGFYPDSIIEYQQSADVAKGEPTPFWIRITSPKDAPAGIYKANVVVTADNCASYTFPLEVRVFGFNVPVGSPILTALNYDRMSIKVGWHEPYYYPLQKKMALKSGEYRLSFDSVFYGPWGDHSKFDAEKDVILDIYRTLHKKGQLGGLCILNFSPMGAKDQADPNDPAIDRLIENALAKLRNWVPILKKEGMLDKAYIYGYDEVKVSDGCAKILRAIKKEFPEIPAFSTGFGELDDPNYLLLDGYVPGIACADDPERVAKMRALGKKVWWYTCNYPRPPKPSLMLQAPGVLPRLFLGMMTQKYKPDGFLHWALNWARKMQEVSGPIMYGPRTTWDPRLDARGDNGEGMLFVPGKDKAILPTIRIENMRDGLEDLWYYKLLEKAIAENPKADAALLKKAEAALVVPENIVRSSDKYTRYPEIIRSERRKIAELIEKLQK